MKKAIYITIAIILVIAAFVTLFVMNRNLRNEITVIKSNHSVELIRVKDSIKSAEFEVLQKELKVKDSIYCLQIEGLQNEKKRLTTDYNRLNSSYSAITIERPKW